jgi:hypothetical protein
MHEHGSLPRARKDDLLEETVGEELLIYDRDSHTAHCLSPIAAGVWRHCDGERDVTGLAELTGASENLVADALHELREKDLLAAEPTLMQSTALGISRRDAIVRVARAGAAAAAAPLIVSATAATPAMASSGGGGSGVVFKPSALVWFSGESQAQDLELSTTANFKLLKQFTTDETDFETLDPNSCIGKVLASPCKVQVKRKTATVTGLKRYKLEVEDLDISQKFVENGPSLEGR